MLTRYESESTRRERERKERRQIWQCYFLFWLFLWLIFRLLYEVHRAGGWGAIRYYFTP